MSHTANDRFFKNVVFAPSERYLQQNRSRQLALMLAALHLSDPMLSANATLFKRFQLFCQKLCRNKWNLKAIPLVLLLVAAIINYLLDVQPSLKYCSPLWPREQ